MDDGGVSPTAKVSPTKVSPQITASDWVERDDATLARVMMHGLEGLIHVNGKLREDIKVVRLPSPPYLYL